MHAHLRNAQLERTWTHTHLRKCSRSAPGCTHTRATHSRSTHGCTAIVQTHLPTNTCVLCCVPFLFTHCAKKCARRTGPPSTSASRSARTEGQPAACPPKGKTSQGPLRGRCCTLGVHAPHIELYIRI